MPNWFFNTTTRELVEPHEAKQAAWSSVGRQKDNNDHHETKQQPSYVSLDGIKFAIHSASSTRLILNEPYWVNRHDGYGALSVSTSEDVCFLSGVVRPDHWALEHWASLIATVPTSCCPSDGDLLFGVNSGKHTHQIMVSDWLHLSLSLPLSLFLALSLSLSIYLSLISFYSLSW